MGCCVFFGGQQPYSLFFFYSRWLLSLAKSKDEYVSLKGSHIAVNEEFQNLSDLKQSHKSSATSLKPLKQLKKNLSQCGIYMQAALETVQAVDWS
jgi:hypothetical protein